MGKSDRALIVLCENVFYQFIPLSLKEHSGPDGIRQIVASANDLGFGGTFGV